MTIGENIKKARIKAGLKQSDLAEKMGITQSAIAKFEKNKTNIKLSTIRKISEALELPLSDLIGNNWNVFGIEEIKKDWKSPTKYAVRDDLLYLHDYELIVDEEDVFFALAKDGYYYEITEAELDSLTDSTLDFFGYRLNKIIKNTVPKKYTKED